MPQQFDDRDGWEKLNAQSNLASKREAEALRQQAARNEAQARYVVPNYEDGPEARASATYSRKAAAICLYAVGVGMVVASWLGYVNSDVGWGGFGVSIFGAMIYRAQQPSWMRGLAMLVWAVGMIFIVAAWGNAVSIDLAWVGLALTVLGGGSSFIEIPEAAHS